MAVSLPVTLSTALRPAREAFLIFVVLGTCSVTAVLLAGKYGEEKLVQSLEKTAMDAARTASLVLDKNLHHRLVAQGSMWTEEHKRALRPLVALHQNFPEITRIRTFAMEGGRVAVILDTETVAGEIGMQRPVDPTDIHSPLNEADPAYEVVENALARGEQGASDVSTNDGYRTFRPAAVPFGNGSAVATELEVSTLENTLTTLRAWVLFGVGIAVIACGVVSLIYFNIRSAHIISETTGGEAARGQQWQEARNQRLVQALGQLVVYRDMESDRLLWDGDTLKHLGIAFERMPLHFEEWLNHLHPEDVQAVRTAARRTTPENPTYEVDYRARNAAGELIWFNERGVVTYELEDNEYVAKRCDSVLHDITAHRREQDEMAALALIASRTDNAVCLTSPDGRIRWVNAAFTRATGFTSEEAINQPIKDLVTTQGKSESLAALVHDATAGNGRNAELLLTRKDREEYWARVEIQPLLDDKGEITRLVMIQSDISAAKEMEARLTREKELAESADRAKSEFLAVMSHEIRTPLNAVIGFTGLLLNTELNDQQRDYIDTIRTSSDSLLHLLNDILEFSKMEAKGIELDNRKFELRGCIEDAIDVLSQTASSKDVDLIADLDPGLPAEVIGDRARLRQILINLTGNAVKFTDEGQVTVAARLAPGGRLRVEVADTGPGISLTEQEKLFKPFSQADSSATRKHGGTGLGLAICKRLINMMGGEIGVESTPGIGSTFWFEIPLKITIATPPERSASGMRILVAESNSTLRAVLARQLSYWGMQVEVCPRGRDALFAAEYRRFDVALVDLDLPDIAGDRLADRLRHMPRRNVGSVVLMGNPQRLPTSKRGPVESFYRLPKPIRMSALAEMIFRAAPRVVPRATIMPETAQGSLNLPIKESSPQTEKAPATTRKRILVADDNAINRKLAKKLLDGMGYSPELVCNGLECVEAVKNGSFDAILMDLQMPEMDGLSATRAIRAFGSRIPIIAITADAMPDDRERCLQAGMDDYLQKPIRPDALEDALSRAAAANA